MKRETLLKNFARAERKYNKDMLVLPAPPTSDDYSGCYDWAQKYFRISRLTELNQIALRAAAESWNYHGVVELGAEHWFTSLSNLSRRLTGQGITSETLRYARKGFYGDID